MYRNDTPSRVRRSLDNFEARRQVMLEKGLAVYADPESYPDPAARVLKRDIYAATAALNLFYGKYVRESIDQVIRTARWFDLPHPNGRDPRGESTFAAMGMLPTLYYNWDKLTDEARAAVDRFFLTKNFESMYESENHRLQHHTALYLAGQFYGERTFEWCGKTGTQIAAETGAWLKRFVHFRAKEGWGEFDSLGYLDVDFGCLLLLADLSRDKELATISRMMLDVLLLDMVVDSKNGLYGGAHGRIYPPTALNILCGGMAADYYLYIGLDNDESERRALKFLPGVPVAALMVDYRPDPVVLEMALGRVGAYENREAKHLHCIPKEQQPGRISKYSYVTDKYIVGAINRQDDYDPNTRAALVRASRAARARRAYSRRPAREDLHTSSRFQQGAQPLDGRPRLLLCEHVRVAQRSHVHVRHQEPKRVRLHQRALQPRRDGKRFHPRQLGVRREGRRVRRALRRKRLGMGLR